jgi:hypothetical protein
MSKNMDKDNNTNSSDNKDESKKSENDKFFTGYRNAGSVIMGFGALIILFGCIRMKSQRVK